MSNVYAAVAVVVALVAGGVVGSSYEKGEHRKHTANVIALNKAGDCKSLGAPEPTHPAAKDIQEGFLCEGGTVLVIVPK